MRFLAKMQGTELPPEKFIIEINPEHPIVKEAYALQNEDTFKDWAQMIFMQATLADEGTLRNPRDFIKLVNRIILKQEGEAVSVKPSTDAKDASIEV